MGKKKTANPVADVAVEEVPRPKGRGFGSFTKGEKVTSLLDMKYGEMLLEYSHQFDSQNIIRITNVRPHDFTDPGEIIYARFVNPQNPSEFAGIEFAIWDFELSGKTLRYDLWRAIADQNAVPAEAPAVAPVQAITDVPHKEVAKNAKPTRKTKSERMAEMGQLALFAVA